MKRVRPVLITDTNLISTNVPEDDYLTYLPATTYALGDRQISGHKIYESLQAANLGHDPATSPLWWLDLNIASNPWRMFDGSSSSQTTHTDSISVTLYLASRIDTIGLRDIAAATARVTMTDPVDGVVYDRTINLISPSGITNWWAYFHEPIVRATSCLFTDLPAYGGLTVTITLSNPGLTVACGICALGLSQNLGGTQYGMALGLKDYSIEVENGWGDTTLKQGKFRRTLDLTVEVDNDRVDWLVDNLAQYRSIPMLYIGTERFGSSVLYGYYRDARVVVSYFAISILSIEIKNMV